MFTKEIIEKYIEYVCIYRVKSWYKEISLIEEVKETEDELRNKYSNKGGISAWLAEKLEMNLIDLGNLESDNNIMNEKAKIDKLFKNQFTEERKNGFGSFKDFYEWYIKQEDRCFYCDISSETLKLLFDSQKLSSTKFNSTLHIERLNPKEKYSKENCRLACSLCNNTKSDLISKANYKKYFAATMSEFLSDLQNNKIENNTF